MKKAIILWMAICIFLSLSACATLVPVPAVTATPSVTATPDLCSTAYLPNAVKAVNNLTRQFDDYAALAKSTPKSQLVQVIPPLQTIRRAAQDQVVPACLKQLKIYQISYMDTLIQTLLVFDSSQNTSDANILNNGLAQAQQYRNQYVIELAHLLGMTVVVPPTVTAGTPAAVKTNTPNPTAPVITITNPGSDPINLHSSASLTSQTIGTLNAGASAPAIGKSAAGDWVLIQVNGKPAWIFASLIKFTNGDIAALPLATPAP
jgi:hypothetical protein